MQINKQGELTLPGLKVSSVEQDLSEIKFDLTLNVLETEKGLEMSWAYSKALFNSDTIEHMACHFELLLKGVLENPRVNIYSAPMLSEKERYQQLVDWNNTLITW